MSSGRGGSRPATTPRSKNIDWNLGRIRDTLTRTGLADDTHIVFFCDHGDLLGSHGWFRKTASQEESARMPLVLGGGPARYRYSVGRVSHPVSLVDLAPTTLGLCGIDKPDWMEGTDLSGYRRFDRPAPAAPDSVYLDIAVPTGALDTVALPWRAIITRAGWKYAVFPGLPWVMYDLNEDPYELVNLAYEPCHAAERRRLQARLAEWINATGDSFPLADQ